MFRFVLRRVLGTIPVILVVSIAVFLLLYLTPGDPAVVIAGEFATPEQIAMVRDRLGLDRPMSVQLMNYLGNLVRGDFGTSIFSQLPVTTLIAQRLEPTISLAIATLLLAVPIAIMMGVAAARFSGTIWDHGIMFFSVIGFSIPAFVIGYLLIYVFAINAEVLPVQGFVSIREGAVPFLERITLPAVTLSIFMLAVLSRVTRATMLEVLGEDFIRTARAKGASEVRVLFRHGLRNAAVPIVTVIGFSITSLISGVVVVETVFNIPGVGSLVVGSILKRDYPVIQGLILMFSLFYVYINLVIDIVYAALDPRIRY